MTTIEKRVSDAVESMECAAEVAEKFIDPSYPGFIETKKGSFQSLPQIAAIAASRVGEIEDDLAAQAARLVVDADAAISRIAHFSEEVFEAGRNYTTDRVYFIHSGTAYTPLAFPYLAGESLVDDIAANRFTVLQGLTHGDIGEGIDQIATNRNIYENIKYFDGLSSVISFVALHQDRYTRVRTDSFRTRAECDEIGVDYPDGGGSDYLVEDLHGPAYTYSTIRIGNKQLRLIADNRVCVKQFGAFGNGVDDDHRSIALAIDFMYRLGGGIVLLQGATNGFLVDSDLIIKRRVSLQGVYTSPGELNNSWDQSDYKQSIILNTAASIITNDNSSLTNFVIRAKGLSTPFEDMEDAAAAVLAFSGTAIKIMQGIGAARDVVIHDGLILGFNLGVDGTSQGLCERLKLFDINFDCTNGIDLQRNTDVSHVKRLHCWPFVTAHRGYGLIERQGVAYKISNVADWLRVTNSFSYGWATGFLIHDANDVTLINCGSDSDHRIPTTSTGVAVSGNSKRTRLVAFQSAAQGIAYDIDIRIESQSDGVVTLDGCSAWGNNEKVVLVQGGSAIITGGVYVLDQNPGVSPSSAIHVGLGANRVSVADAYFEDLPVFDIDPSAVDRVLIGDNTYENCTQTYHSIRRSFTEDAGRRHVGSAVSISQDLVHSLELSDHAKSGVITIHRAGDSMCMAVFDGVQGTVKVAVDNLSQFNAAAGVLTGTTGADGKINISAENGVLYIENRLPITAYIAYSISACR